MEVQQVGIVAEHSKKAIDNMQLSSQSMVSIREDRMKVENLKSCFLD